MNFALELPVRSNTDILANGVFKKLLSDRSDDDSSLRDKALEEIQLHSAVSGGCQAALGQWIVFM